MSVVVGIEHGAEVWMAADSLVSDGEIIFETNEPPKLFEWNGILLGAVGSFRVGNVLHESFEPPQLKANEEPMSYMMRKFIPALCAVFEEYDIDTKPKVVAHGFELQYDWSIMVGLCTASGGRIYVVDDDLSVARCADNYAFIGTGGEVAAGALFATTNYKLKPETRIERAVAAACKHVASVGGKIVVENI